MHQAAEYLHKLVACDGSPQGEPPPCPFIFDGMPAPVWVPPLVQPSVVLPPDNYVGSIGQPTPAEVQVGPVQPAAAKKRPAAAKKPAAKKRPAAAQVPEASAGAPAAEMEPAAPAGAGVPRARKVITLPDLLHGQTLGCAKCK